MLRSAKYEICNLVHLWACRHLWRCKHLPIAALLLATALPLHAQTLSDRPPAPPPYPGSLPFFYDLYTFRGDAGATLVVAAFAVSAGELESRRIGRDAVYRFDVTLVVADTLIRSVARSADSAYIAAGRRLPDRHLLYTHVQVEAPPSVHTVQRVVMTDANKPGIGQLYDTALPVPDYSGTDLMLSDIALGQPDPGGGWDRGDATIAILPVALFPESSFDIYYEVYNLPDQHRYVTEIAVQPVSGEGGPPREDVAAALRFRGKADYGDGADDGDEDSLQHLMLPELRRISGELEAGRYRITVTVTDEDTGETASRSRLFEVRGSGEGATIVVARPRS